MLKEFIYRVLIVSLGVMFAGFSIFGVYSFLNAMQSGHGALLLVSIAVLVFCSAIVSAISMEGWKG